MKVVKEDHQTSRASAKSLLHTWIKQNPELIAHLTEKDWDEFLQALLKSLKTRNRWFVQKFLETALPDIIQKGILKDIFLQALQNLRALLLSSILETPQIKVSQRNALLRETLNLFDYITKTTHTIYSEHSFISTLTFLNASTEKILHLDYMGYHISHSRFQGSGYYNEAFQDWIGKRWEDLPVTVNWKQLVHPEDFPRIENWFLERLKLQQPFYVMNYRLQHKDGDWRHVYEFGRIIYNEEQQPVSFLGVITEANASKNKYITEQGISGVFNALVDSEEEYLFVLNRSGKILYATHQFLNQFNIFPPAPQRMDISPWEQFNSPFFELLDSRNKIEAEQYWKAILKEPYVNSTMVLHLPGSKNTTPMAVEFSCFPVQKPFQKSLYIFWGSVRQERLEETPLSKQHQTLIRINNTLRKSASPGELIANMPHYIERLFPVADLILVLGLEKSGVVVKNGKGIDLSLLKNRVILLPDEVEKLSVLKIFRQLPGKVLHLDASSLWELFSKVLSDQRLTRLEKETQFLKTQDWLLGVVNIQQDSPLIVSLGAFRNRTRFSSLDGELLHLFLQSLESTFQNIFFHLQLEEKKAIYSTLLEKTTRIIVILQNDQLVLYNPGYQELISVDNDVAMESNFWQFVHPNDAGKLMKELDKLTHPGDSITTEFRIITPFQQEKICQGIFTRIVYHRKTAILGEIIDRTNQKKLERRLQQSKRLENIGLITNGIVHDFNNLLSAIIPSAQMLIQSSDSPQVKQYAENIAKLARRAGHITRQLTLYAQLESDRVELLNLNQIIEEARDILHGLIGPNITLDYQLAPSLPQVTGEKQQLLQILINVIHHAKNRMGGKGRIRISTSTRRIQRNEKGLFRTIRPGDYVVLTIQDSAPGLHEQLQMKLFEPFLTTREIARGSGTDVSMIYGISHKQEGYMVIKSDDANGNLFKLLLPTEEKVVDTSQDTASQGSIGPNPGKILVVEDETYLRDVMTGMLKLMGFSYYEAGNGEEAVELFKKHHQEIDTIFLDYIIPGMSGQETFYELRKINPDVHIVICTGYVEQKEITPLLKLPNVSFLPKPFTLETLSKQLEERKKN
ncbi:MAG: response regulator [Calditrichaeota bacterium]|nr:MAG: response regulator [Calditrichota bacterium]